ncbi:MAG: hypothetical protein HYY24_12680 [Verrucomicrobia bacterium]|nr:hypothetical protein [Verrucomicrobiota bacterium]
MKSFRLYSSSFAIGKLVAAVAFALTTASSVAQIISLPSTYAEDFDEMGAGTPGGNTTTPSGWDVGFSSPLTMGTTAYVFDSDDFFAAKAHNVNFGVNGESDRALGSVASSTGATRYTRAHFRNDTGSTITSLIISYTGEQWSIDDAGIETGLVLKYSTDGTTFSAAGLGTSFNFSAPVTSGSPRFLNGNDSANRTTGRGGTFVPSLPIANGTEFYLRWEDSNDPDSDSGVGIDDFSVTAVPEPQDWGLLASAAMFVFALLHRRFTKPA